MRYDAEAIEKRRYLLSRIKIAAIKLLWVVLIIMLYNIFLIAKSSLSQSGAKDVFGYRAYIITTNSMKPALRVGSVIITTNVPEEKIKIGDIITFERDGDNISHRIVDIKDTDAEKQYITKGDDNNVEDTDKITYADIEGTEVLVIPYLGSIVLILGNKIYIVLLVLLLLLIFLHVSRVNSKRRMRREKKRNEDKKVQNSDNNGNS